VGIEIQLNLQKWKVKAMNKDSGEVEEYD